MKKINKGLLQTGLVIGIASVFTAGLLLTKFKGVIDINSIIASVINEPCNEYHATDGCSGAHAECRVKADGPHHCKWIDTGWTEVWVNEAGGEVMKCKGRCVNGHDPIIRPTPTSAPTRTPRPTRTPVPTSTPRPTVTPTATGTPISNPTPTMTATPTSVPGEPNYCGGTCGSNYNCRSGFFCYNGYCRNPQCADVLDCDCKASPTTPPVLGISTARELPKTGGGLGFVTFSSLLGGLGFWLFKKSR